MALPLNENEAENAEGDERIDLSDTESFTPSQLQTYHATQDMTTFTERKTRSLLLELLRDYPTLEDPALTLVLQARLENAELQKNADDLEVENAGLREEAAEHKEQADQLWHVVERLRKEMAAFRRQVAAGAAQ